MANLTFHQKPIQTIGDFPKKGEKIPDFKLVGSNLAEISLTDFAGKSILFSILPSVDTAVCSTQLKTFSQKMTTDDTNTILLFASLDLPFAFSRFCQAEGIANVVTASDFRYKSLQSYGVEMQDGPIRGLYARAVIVCDPQHQVVHSELVKEVSNEPDYEVVLQALSTCS